MLIEVICCWQDLERYRLFIFALWMLYQDGGEQDPMVVGLLAMMEQNKTNKERKRKLIFCIFWVMIKGS